MALGPLPRPAMPSPASGTGPGPAGALGLRLVTESVARDDSIDTAIAELSERWRRGECPRVEDYIERLGLGAHADAVDLIYAEFCLAEAGGQEPDTAEYLARFPAQRAALSRLLGLHGLFVGPDSLAAELPEAGDSIGSYHLLRELGRGALARVFLAEQADLEHRLVVLKVSTRATAEPRLLARARHDHIVEVLRHAEIDDGALHLLCLPFLGGSTLSAILLDEARRGVRPRSGRDFLADLDRVSAPEFPPPTSRESPVRALLEGLSYARACAWTVARLAVALDHACQRGVIHGDLKPSNILVAADGRPMLLDFNLALDGQLASLPAEAGGTLAYMAPERLRSFLAGGSSGRPRLEDRHRGDIYSLGLVLLEMLIGAGPEAAGAAGPLHSAQPSGTTADSSKRSAFDARAWAADLAARRQDGGACARLLGHRRVPPALRPILGRCLAPDPADRYRRASQLAEDLDRYGRDERPLHAAGDGWTADLWRRLRRHRRLVAATCLVLAGATGATAILVRTHRDAMSDLAREKLESLWSGDKPGVYGGIRLSQSDGFARMLNPSNSLQHLEDYGVLHTTAWRDRDDVRRLSDPLRIDLDPWLAEQAWRYARVVLDRREPGERELQLAWTALHNVAGGSAPGALGRLSTEIESALARHGIQPVTPGVKAKLPAYVLGYLEGVEAELGAREHARAVRLYEEVLRQVPDSFWAQYRAAVASWMIPDYTGAAMHLEHCVRQRPDVSSLHLAYAGLLYRLERNDEALAHAQRAVVLNPESADAFRTLAIVRRDLGQEKGSQQDFKQFRLKADGDRSLSSWTMLQDAVRILAMFPHAEGEMSVDEEIERLRAAAVESVDARVFLACRLRDLGQLEEALTEFERACATDPDHLFGQYSRAWLLRRMGLVDDAVSAMRDLLRHPRFPELLVLDEHAIQVYRSLASALLTGNRAREAIAVLDQGRERVEWMAQQAGGKDGSRFERLRAEMDYSLARSWASLAGSDPGALRRAQTHLEQAAERLPEQAAAWARADRALEALQQPPDGLAH